MVLVLLMSKFDLLGQGKCTLRAHFGVRQVEADKRWEDAFNQVWCLRAQIIKRQVEDLKVKVGICCFDQAETIKTPDSDATV